MAVQLAALSAALAAALLTAADLGLDVILGAFAAGLIVRLILLMFPSLALARPRAVSAPA